MPLHCRRLLVLAIYIIVATLSHGSIFGTTVSSLFLGEVERTLTIHCPWQKSYAKGIVYVDNTDSIAIEN